MADSDNQALAAAAIQSAASLAGTAITNVWNEENMEDQMEFAKRQWEANVNLENVRRDEDRFYSSPLYRRQQYENAGLNPYMMLDSYNASVPNTMSAPGTSMPSVPSMVDFGGSLASGLDAARVALESKQVQKGLQKADQEIRKLAAESTSVEMDNEFKKDMQPKQLAEMDLQLKKLSSDIAVNKANKKLIKAQTAYQMGLLKTEDLLRNEKLNNLLQDTFQKAANVKLTEQETKNLAMAYYGIYFDNLSKVQTIYLNGLEFRIKKATADGLEIEANIKNTKEWQEAYKRFGLSDDELKKDYVNGITSTLGSVIITSAMMWFLKKGNPMYGVGQGSLRSPQNSSNTYSVPKF